MGVEIAVPRLSRGDDITGLEAYPRWVPGEVPLSTSFIYLSFVTATQARTVTKAVTNSAGAAAGATPTRCRVGVWEVDGSGNGTLVASTANTTSLWGATYTKYETALSSSLTLKAGQRYAMGCVIASGASLPNLYGCYPPGAVVGLAPRVSGYLAPSSGDLPASFTEASIASTGSGAIVYVALIP